MAYSETVPSRNSITTSSFAPDTQWLNATGYASPGDGGAAGYLRVPSQPSHPGKVQSADGAWWELSAPTILPEMFGATGDGATDDAGAINDAIAYLNTMGGGALRLRARIYIVNQPVRMRSNTMLQGASRDTSVIKVGVDDIQAIANVSGTQTGLVCVRDLTVWGYYDRNPTSGSFKLIQLTTFTEVEIANVRAIYARNMSITISSSSTNFKVTVSNCLVQYSRRDAINLSGSRYIRVVGNVIENCADDSIACHTNSAWTNLTFDESIIVANNRITKSYGIKCLGARNATITGNVLRFYYGHGVSVARDDPEGNTTRFAISIANNNFIDGMSSQLSNELVGESFAIYLAGDRSIGGGTTTVPNYIGDPSSGTIVEPAPWINRHGADVPRAANFGISVTGNTITQTIDTSAAQPIAKFSDAGYGTLFSKAGDAFDPAMTTLIRTMRGVYLNGSFDGVCISANAMNGVSHGIMVGPASVAASMARNILIQGNSVSRALVGVSVPPPSAWNCQVVVQDNYFDIDPYLESPDRTLAGGWSTTAGNDYVALYCNYALGVVFTGNTVKNARRPVSQLSGLAAVYGNLLYADWSDGALKGLGAIDAPYANKVFYQVSDPTSASFGQISPTRDSAFNQAAASMPSTGYYYSGTIVANSAPAISGGRVLTGWLRLTNGNAHVSGIDWAPQYVAAA